MLMAAACASVTRQNTIASTPTATVSRVSACSAVMLVVWMRVSITIGDLVDERAAPDTGRAAEPAEPAEPQHHGTLPLVGDAHRAQQASLPATADEQDNRTLTRVPPALNRSFQPSRRW